MDNFISYCLSQDIIKFGTFTLKSGRTSPYFFNSGAFYQGKTLSRLIDEYAKLILRENLSFDIFFGPAYKGISLASGLALHFAERYSKNYSFCYDRKEIKNHGEGGKFVGAPLAGNLLIIDDVVTAGTTLQEHIQTLIKKSEINIVGIIIAFDRMERLEISETHSIPIYSITDANQLLKTLQNSSNLSYLEQAKTLEAHLALYRR
ncbi:MAG: orotate phosphoribosyltransferase [Methylacidiphilales bacterium]|nr:orotate phosphoribosyltransferase [Candidatus Methylacidiphilales bacterium]